jgi:hypothetical protein
LGEYVDALERSARVLSMKLVQRMTHVFIATCDKKKEEEPGESTLDLKEMKDEEIGEKYTGYQGRRRIRDATRRERKQQ